MTSSEISKTDIRNDPRDEISRYDEEIEGDITPARKLLEQYSKIPPDEVIKHIHAVVGLQIAVSQFSPLPAQFLYSLLLQNSLPTLSHSMLTNPSPSLPLSARKPGKSTHTPASAASAS